MKKILTPILSVIRTIVPPLLLTSASFILSMHWFLLMADSLVDKATTEIVPAPIISTIIGYYTVVFGPMTWLIKLMILTMFLSMTLQLTIRDIPWYVRYTIFLTHAPLTLNGIFYIIPMVDKLILNNATPEIQSQYVRTIHNAHTLSFYGAVLMIVLQIIAIIILQKKAEKKQA